MLNKSYQKFIFFCFLLIFAIPSHVLAQEAEEMEDTMETIPFATITHAQLNQKALKAGDTLKYSFTLTDIGTWKYKDIYDGEYFWGFSQKGIYEVEVVWESSKKQTVTQTFKWNRKKHAKSMRISGKIPVKKGMQPGTWRLAEIELLDGDPNNVPRGDEGPSILYIFDLRDKNTIMDTFYRDYLDLSFSDFVVEGTKAEHQAPKISKKSLKVSKKYMGAKQKSTFSVKVTDQSGVDKVYAVWEGAGLKNEWYIGDFPMKYNKKKKCYQCTVKFPYAYLQKMELRSIRVQDIYGNEKSYYAGDGSKESRSLQKAYSKVTIYRK